MDLQFDTGSGLHTATAGSDITHIDPDRVFLSSALAFAISGGGARASLRGDTSIYPARAPEPALIPLIGLGLVIGRLWRWGRE